MVSPHSLDFVSVLSLNLSFLFYNLILGTLPSLILPFALKALVPVVPHLNAVSLLSPSL